MKKSVSVILCAILSVTALAQRAEVHIVSCNDVHAKIENMPRLAAIVDSLRAEYDYWQVDRFDPGELGIKIEP